MSDTTKLIGQIIEGHGNKLLNKVGLLPEDLKKLSELRLSLCRDCHTLPHPGKPGEMGPGLEGGKYCNKKKGGCGCDMDAKSKAIGAHCPIGRW